MQIRFKSTPGIYLVGFMGCGKTTVGRELAQILEWEFVDLDDEIERRAEISISEIFTQHGESSFREIESDALLEQIQIVAEGHTRVVALGGGTFGAKQNRKIIKQAGLSVWLNVPLEELWQRVSSATHRPLAKDRARFEALYEERLMEYMKADFSIEAKSKDSAHIAHEIIDLLLQDFDKV